MKDIRILTSDEVKNITPESLKLDAVQIDRIQNVRKWLKLLEEEKKAWDNAILEKYNHKPTDDGKVKITISDYMIFDSDAFRNAYGEEEYNKFKVKPVHKEQVKI